MTFNGRVDLFRTWRLGAERRLPSNRGQQVVILQQGFLFTAKLSIYRDGIVMKIDGEPIRLNVEPRKIGNQSKPYRPGRSSGDPFQDVFNVPFLTLGFSPEIEVSLGIEIPVEGKWTFGTSHQNDPFGQLRDPK